jgi:hypothetical protein
MRDPATTVDLRGGDAMAEQATISQKHRTFIEAQHVFFVATAPLAVDGHINLSPKGLAGMLQVIDEQTIAWLDLYGSGIETTAHVRENGRLCIMLCSFDEKPGILRLQGHAEVIEPDHVEFDTLRANFPNQPICRSIIRLRVDRIAFSCGFGVPRYDFGGHRTTIPELIEKQDEGEMRDYIIEHNATSIDGLPGATYWTERS